MEKKELKIHKVNKSDLKIISTAKIRKNIRDKVKEFLYKIHLLSYEKVEKNNDTVENTSKKISLNIHLRHLYYKDLIKGDNGKGRPKGFEYQKIIKNLVDTLTTNRGSIQIKVWIYYTGTNSQLDSDPSMTPIFSSNLDYEIKFLESSSALESWLIMLRLIKEQGFSEDEILYILENDYIHHEDWLICLKELIQSEIMFDYLTLYDHPDRYIKAQRYNKSEIYVTRSKHWVDTDSSCASFITSYKMFLRDYNEFYTHRHDDKIFRTLTKTKKRKLIMPIPALSTHAELAHLSPVSKLEDILLN